MMSRHEAVSQAIESGEKATVYRSWPGCYDWKRGHFPDDPQAVLIIEEPFEWPKKQEGAE